MPFASRILSTMCTVIILALLAPGPAHGMDDLESALRAALEENQNAKTDIVVHDYRLFNHLFGVPPLIFEKQSKRFLITGTLIHHHENGKKDQIKYRIVKEKGAISEIRLQVNGGEFRPASDAILTALGDYRKAVPISDEKQEEVRQALRNAVDDTWQRAAEFLIAHIAIRHC